MQDPPIRDPLIKAIEKVRTRDPEEYNVFSQDGVLITVFTRFEKSVPVVVVSKIELVENHNGPVELNYRVQSYPTEQPSGLTVSVGGSSRANDLEVKTRDYWNRGSVAGVRELIKISIADNPSKTGEPIDILKFSKSGTSWIQVKPDCEFQSSP
jgi:hypothetical protein